MTISSLSCDATTGKPRWFTDTIGAYNGESPLIANGVVYVCAISLSQSWVYALDAATGRTLWVSPPFSGQTFTSPVVADGVVYAAIGSMDCTVYAFHLPKAVP